MAVNLGTRGIQEACRPARVLQPPRRHATGRTCGSNTASRSRTASSSGASATRSTDRGRSATRPRTSTAGWRPRPPRPCGWSTPTSSWSLCGSSNSPDADVRRVGGRGARAHLRAGRLHLAARLLRGDRRRPGQLPRLARRTWTRFIDAVVATADHVGAKLRSRKKIKLSFDEWNVWYQSRFVGQRTLDVDLAAPELIEDEFTAADAVVVGELPHHAAAARRPGRRRLPGAARQHHRADPHRARRPGLAADHLPPVRADGPARARAPCCGSSRASHRVDTAKYGDVAALDATATYDEETGAHGRSSRSTATCTTRAARGRPARDSSGSTASWRSRSTT